MAPGKPTWLQPSATTVQRMGEEPIFHRGSRSARSPARHVQPEQRSSYDHLFEQVRNARLLILDDLGTQSATPWAKEKLFQILNYRYEARLPTVITTSSSLDEIDARIRSRMLDVQRCSIYAILAPSFRNTPASSGRTRK